MHDNKSNGVFKRRLKKPFAQQLMLVDIPVKFEVSISSGFRDTSDTNCLGL